MLGKRVNFGIPVNSAILHASLPKNSHFSWNWRYKVFIIVFPHISTSLQIPHPIQQPLKPSFVLTLDVPEDPEPSDLIVLAPEVHCAGRVDGSRAVSQKLEFLCEARQEWLTSSASRTGIPRDWFSGINHSANPHIWVRRTLLNYNSFHFILMYILKN